MNEMRSAGARTAARPSDLRSDLFERICAAVNPRLLGGEGYHLTQAVWAAYRKAALRLSMVEYVDEYKVGIGTYEQYQVQSSRPGHAPWPVVIRSQRSGLLLESQCECESFMGTDTQPPNCAVIEYEMLGGYIWMYEWERSRHRRVKVCWHIVAAWLWAILSVGPDEDLYREAATSRPYLGHE